MLLLDTEGLESPERQDSEYDRKIVLFAMLAADILIVNSKGEINTQMIQTLQICTVAYDKLKPYGDKPEIHYIFNQIPVTFKEFLQSMGIPSIFPREYEADDAIGFINDTLRQLDDFKHTIVTVDRDLCQLIDENVCVYDPIRKIEINIGNFEEKLKYKKEDFIKVKALAGDKSDNIPGIKGFGNARIKKYLEGDITLTLEQQEIFERNLELVTTKKDWVRLDKIYQKKIKFLDIEMILSEDIYFL